MRILRVLLNPALLAWAVCPAFLLCFADFSSADEVDEIIERGKAIYAESCTDCHGAGGQGVEGSYDHALVGDATVGELTRVISETMPEEDPDACVAEDAASVASYIHYAFYSEAARLRNRPPRASLARLTAEQLRQSLADLYVQFEKSSWMEKSRGLEGVYFTGARWKDENKKIERTDAVLDFDFGDEGPGEGIDAKEFYIHWGGSLRVRRTGRYEIVLRSTCSCTMRFGSTRRMLINNHVQSEGKTEFRRTLQLVAGRNYPIKVEFFQRKRKTEQPPARISLSWVPPGGVEQIIPERNLIPTWMPAQFALQSKLPPDDRSYGYERGIAVNRQWDQSTTAAAIEFAEIVEDELWPRYRQTNRKIPMENRKRLRTFLDQLVRTAHRRPLDDAARKLYIDRQLDQAEDDAEAIRRVVLISLKSPRFLYPTLDRDVSKSQRIANRLALVLHDSLPSDRWLVQRIDKNQIQTDKQVRDVAWKMVHDDRAAAKITGLLYHWFDLSASEEITKDAERFPGFDDALVSDLRASFDAFLDEVVSSEACDYRQLLQSDWMFTNERLAAFYGDAWRVAPDQQGDSRTDHDVDPDVKESRLFRSVSDREARSGLLTHPLLMSSLAGHKASSPIHRGVLVYRHLLGRTLRPPNAAFTPLDPDLHPGLTTRERIEMQTGDVDCQACHEKINSVGFALEQFDASGRYRSKDNQKAVDASGTYINRDGEKKRFENSRQLAEFLAGSSDCHRAFVEAAFEHFVKQPIAAYGAETTDRLTKHFTENGFNIRSLMVEIAVIAATQQEANPET